MNNYFETNDTADLDKIFDLHNDKLIVLLFHDSGKDSRKTKNYFQRVAGLNNFSIFCAIDIEKMDKENIYVKNINNVPKFECFFLGNSLGSFHGNNERDIESNVGNFQRYVISYNNNMNNQNKNVSYSQPNIDQVKNAIITRINAQNPQYANYLMNNPMALNTLVQQQMASMQNQYNVPQYNQPNFFQGAQQNNTMPGIPQNSPIPGTPQNKTINMMSQLANEINSSNDSHDILPTLQQMKQMFKIFKMMQQMGVIKDDAEITEDNEEETDDIINLPSGEKLVPLPGGKFGLIKKNN